MKNRAMKWFERCFLIRKPKFLTRGSLSLWVLWVLLTSVWAFAGSANVSEFPVNKVANRVLILSPYNLSYAQYHQMLVSYLDGLSRSGQSYWLNQFEIDTLTGDREEAMLRRFESFLEAIEDGEFDAVITFGDKAVDLLARDWSRVPESVSVVFCGQDSYEKNKFAQHPNATGVLEKMAPIESIDLIRELFPKKKKLFLLTNWSPVGKRVLAETQDYLKENPEFELIHIDNETTSTEEMLKAYSRLGEDAVVLFQGWYNHKAINFASLQHLMEKLGNNPEVPLFVMHDSMLRFGTVGGWVVKSEDVGRVAAGVTAKILAGKKASEIDVSSVEKRVVLNWDMLQFYKVASRHIPRNAIILGEPHHIWNQHRDLLISGSVFIVILTLLSLGLLYLFLKNKRFARQMKDVFFHLPVHVAVINEEEKVLLAYLGDFPMPKKLSQGLEFKDFPIIYDTFKPYFTQALETEGVKSVEYVLNGLHRRADFVRLPFSTFGQRSVLWVSVDVQELKTMAQNEMVLNSCLSAVKPEENVNASFMTVLERFCKYLQTDRCYLIRYDFEKDLVLPLTEYCAEGVQDVFSSLTPFPIPHDELWFRRLFVQGQVNVVQCSEDSWEKIKGVWAPLMKKMGIQSLYTSPIFYQGKLWGNIGISFEKRKVVLSDSEIHFIQSIVNVLEIILMRQQYVAQLSKAMEGAMAADKAKSAFLATMSHELRTPLNAVIGFSELLNNLDIPKEEADEYIRNINLAGKALLGLINDILDLSKIEADQMKIVPAPTDVSLLFNELKAVFSQTALSKGIYLEFSLLDTWPLLCVDELRLRQILFNLIGNAIKFTHKGGVSVLARYEGNTLEVKIVDTGIGVSKDQQEAIFKPFVQQDAVRDSSVYKGTGLGLSISQKLAERMNGQLSLESEVNEGSTFTLRLENVTSASKTTESAKPQTPHQIQKDWRVLLVDDVPMNLRLLEMMFRRIKIEAKKAGSGRAALEIMHREKFDLVFTDMWMPQMNGDELAKKIHSLPEFAGVKVIAVTADTRFVSSGDPVFDGVLLKPVTLDSLYKILSS